MAQARLIMVGTGGTGQWWVKGAAEATEVCRPVALVDVVPEHLGQAARANNLTDLPVFADYKEAFDAVEADAVVLVAPNHLHADIGSAALHRGLHVLSEKPLASTMGEALALLALTQERGLLYAVSQNYRWTPGVAALRAAMQANMIGPLSYITYRFAKSIGLRGWRSTIPEILLEDMSIHHFDLLRYLLGREAVRVVARTFRPPWTEAEGRTCAHVLLEFEGGVHVAYTGSWGPRELETTWHGDSWYTGSQGALHFDGADVPTVYLPGQAPGLTPEVAVPIPGPLHALHSFCRAVTTGGEPECAISDNIKSMAIVHAAMVSAAQDGQPVDPRTLEG